MFDPDRPQGIRHDDPMMDRTGARDDPGTWSVGSSGGVVVTAHYLATSAGAEMLGLGGTAADAAVAASLALGVCEPAGSGLGGNALALLHLGHSRETIVLAGACRAPRRATPEAVAASKRYRGYRAVAVPTNAAVLEQVHGRYGRLPRSKVFAPAIRIAEFGYPLTPLQADLTRRYRKILSRHSAGSVFLDTSARPRPAGSWIQSPQLQGTLERLATHGFRDFYKGGIARDIVRTMREQHGFVELDDLEEYSQIRTAAPIRCDFGDLEVCTSPPPGGGLTLLHMLQLYDACERADPAGFSDERLLRLADVIRRARTDRIRFRLRTRSDGVGKAHALIDPNFARTQADELLDLRRGGGETSHISVADGNGNLVSLTQSIERSYGAAEIDPRLGFLYNGFMRGFKIENRRHPHFVGPGVVARSNACPTILLRNRTGAGIIGSTGSERTASSMLQVLAGLRTRTPFEAVSAPRIHATPNGLLMYEDRFEPDTLRFLAAHGFKLKRYEPFSFKFGGLNLVVKQGDTFIGVAEPRRDGAAAGPESPVADAGRGRVGTPHLE